MESLNNLKPFIAEAIQSGLVEPAAILEYAIDRSNVLCLEMIAGKTPRSKQARDLLSRKVWVESNLNAVAERLAS